MPIVLPRSVFFHAGRTGGHWVSHVLWRMGLIERRIYPIHLTPSQTFGTEFSRDEKLAFCFVRHPLHWLASYWRHEMEFGWSDSDVTKVAASDDFPTFLRLMLKAWPDCPCSAHMKPFIDDCAFVGRTETLADSLGEALRLAGETFDPEILSTPAINESSVRRVKAAARAPIGLLKKIMEAEADFNNRFGYAGVPEALIASGASPAVWPRLTLKNEADLGPLDNAARLGVTAVRFSYHFSNGYVLTSKGTAHRLQLAFVEAVWSLPPDGRCAVVSLTDPYVAYLVAESGRDVDFICSNKNILPARVMQVLKHQLSVTESWPSQQGIDNSRYRTVILCDSLEHSITFEIELIKASLILDDGGELLFSAPLIQINDSHAIKMVWPSAMENDEVHKLDKFAFASFGYLARFLGMLSFTDISIIYSSNDVPDEMIHQEVERVAMVFGKDPEQFLGQALIRATFRDHLSREKDDFRQKLLALCLERRLIDLSSAPLDLLPAAVEGTISQLKADLDAEKTHRENAEQGVSDRDQELTSMRKALAAATIDTDVYRILMLKAKSETAALAVRYEQLQDRLTLLSNDLRP
ncbi:MAG: hypothetical protein P4M00_00365 [Azospirillaceae bacterium]|nr:hypothetical protein [Azospirillaceae bacterium]